MSDPFATARSGLAALSLALPLIVACTAADGEGPTDGGDDVVDAGPECSPNLPDPSDPCLANQCGNEIGVGQPCTAGGGECSDWIDVNGSLGASFCTADYGESDLQFCTRPCVVDEICGSGAICQTDPDDPTAGSGCVPITCIGDPPPDGGTPVDAGDDSDAG